MAILPQNDPDPSQRELGLQNKRDLYQYFVPDVPRVPRVESLAAEEKFDTAWTEASTARLARAEGAAGESLTLCVREVVASL